MYDTVHTETRDGFTIRLAFAPEDMDWRDQFDANHHDHAEIGANLDSGKWQWFQARVTAEREGLTLGTAYLGGCMYEGAHDFMAPDGYWPDMVAEAVTEARATLAKLCAEA